MPDGDDGTGERVKDGTTRRLIIIIIHIYNECMYVVVVSHVLANGAHSQKIVVFVSLIIQVSRSNFLIVEPRRFNYAFAVCSQPCCASFFVK